MERVLQLLNQPKPLVHLFYGDSITQGVNATRHYRDYTQLYEEYVRGHFARSLDAVITTAISGNTTRNLLESFEARVTRFKPDLVFLMIGMNDCSESRQLPLGEFEKNLRELTRRFRELGSLAVLQTTCPVIPNGAATDREPHLPAYMEAIRQLAREESLPLVDHYEHWKQLEKFPYNWMEDSFHPNEWGHLVFARFLLRQIGIEQPNTGIFRMPLR